MKKLHSFFGSVLFIIIIFTWGNGFAQCVSPAITTAPNTQTVCLGNTATFTAAASGSASTVQWQVSTDGGATFTAIPGANSPTYSFVTALADNGKQFRALFVNACGSAYTTTGTLTVGTAPSVTTNPTNQAVCAGSAVSFIVAATGTATPTVQWQVSTDGGITFNPIPGATNTDLTFTSSAADNGKQYKAVFVNSCGIATTSVATLTVSSVAPVILTNPSAQSICTGNVVDFSSSASSTPSSAIQWQVSTDGGLTYNNIAGANSNVLSFTTASTDNGKEYRAVFTNACGSAFSQAAILTINSAPVISTQPTSETICAGSSTSFFANAPSSPGSTIQWQVSTDGITFSNVPGATGSTLSFVTAVTDNGKAYRAVFLNTCGSSFTTMAYLTVSSAISITSSPSNQSVCAGATANFSVAATGSPAPTIQWQVSTNGGVTFNNIAGATSATYSFTATVANDASIYQAVLVNACGTSFTTPALLSVNTPFTVTTSPTSQTVCAGSAVTFLCGSTSSPAIQWQRSTDGGVTFSNIAGATSGSYNFTTAVTDNGSIYRAQFVSVCGTSYTTVALLTVSNSAPIVITSPSAQTVCPGTAATFNAAALSVPIPTVQWQVSTNGGVTFNPIAGATNTTFSFTTSAADNGKLYRAQFANVCGSAITTNALLNIGSGLPVVTTTPANQTVCAGATAFFTASATSSPASTIQWQLSTDGGNTFNNIAGATNNSFSLTTVVADNNKRFRALFVNLCGSTFSQAGILTVGSAASSVTTNPVSQTVCTGVPVTFTAAGTGNPLPTMQWQVSADAGVTFSAIAGATSNAFTFTPAPTDNGKLYRAVFSNVCGSATTTEALLTVGTGAPVVAISPASLTVCTGSTAVFTASAISFPAPVLQWQLSTDGGTTFNNIAGATNNNFSFVTATTDNGKQYRVLFTNICGSAFSQTAALTVGTGLPAVITSPTNQIVCAGSPATFTGTGTGFPSPSIQWQVSTNGGVTFSSVAGATSSTYSFVSAGADNGKIFREVFTNVCGSTLAPSASLTVGTTIPTVTTQPLAQTVCTGSTVNFTSIATGFPTPTIQWQVSTDGGVTYNNIAGANTINYSFATSVADNGKIFRALFMSVCGATYSLGVSLTVDVPTVITASPLTQTVCAGTSLTLNSGATGIPAPTIQWQVSPNGGASWLNITAANYPSYTFVPTPANNGYQYRAVYTNFCATVNTAVATITVNSLPAITSQPTNTEVCEGSVATFNINGTGTGITYQWQMNIGAGFVNVPAGAPYVGGNTNTLKVIPVTTAMSGYTFRCIVSGVCPPVQISNVVRLAIDTLPVLISQSPSAATCQFTPISFSVNAIGTRLKYQWMINDPGGSPGSYTTLSDGSVYSGTNTKTLTILDPLVNMNGSIYHCVITAACTPTITTVPDTLTIYTAPRITNQTSSNVTVCNSANDSFLVVATGTNLSYQWQISTNGGSTWANIASAAPYGGVTTPTLTITNATLNMSGNQYRIIVTGTCAPADTSAVIFLSITNNTTWIGQADTKWSNIANWSCGVLPLSTTEVYISSSAPHMPAVDITGAICDSIYFGENTSLSFSGAGNKLELKGSPICDLCTFDASKGTVIYSGTKPQLVIGASTYNNIQIQGTGIKTIYKGDVTTTGSLSMLSGLMVLGDNSVNFGPNANILGGSNASYMVTNGMGVIRMENIGSGGKTADQFVPLSDGSSYTPLTFSNSGVASLYTIAVYNNINSSYDQISLRPTGSALTQYAVGKSWLLSSNGDSANVTLKLQWNASDELTDFNRNACYISTYNNPDWGYAPSISNSLGNDPYTLTMTGLSKMTVFAVTSAVDGKTFVARHGTVTVYPNPASTTLNVKFNGTPGRNVNMYILNNFGREVYRVAVNPYDYQDGIVPVDVTNLYPGEYIISVEDVDDNSEIRTSRFIKP